MNIPSSNCRVDPLSSVFQLAPVLDVLRLDLIHPVVSGNKWFKLKEYLQDAREKNKKTLVSFGGAYSNHIVATAAAAKLKGFNSIGIIRGEQPRSFSPTLVAAMEYGMKLHFVSRKMYSQKTIPREVFEENDKNELYLVPEGGYGHKGMKGAGDILSQGNTSSYTHIICAVGTGTTLAGITNAATGQKIIGIPVLKNNYSLQQEIESLLPQKSCASFQLLHDYHFGGYAKYSRELIQFMNEFYSRTNIPTDFVYTAKAFYAAFDLLKQGFFHSHDAVLLIHTGGLQGNLSLPKGTLIFG